MGTDSPIRRDRQTDGDTGTGSYGASGLDERLFYSTDGNHNVTALVKTGGHMVERYWNYASGVTPEMCDDFRLYWRAPRNLTQVL